MSDLSAEKVVAELRAGADGWEIAVEHEISLYGDGTEDAIGMQARADMYRRAADLIAQQAARLEEVELKWIEAVGLGAEAHAALTAAEAEVGRLKRESISLSALIDLTKGCQHDGGFDREIGPIGCSLGDGCVCCGIVMGARACLSSKKEG